MISDGSGKATKMFEVNLPMFYGYCLKCGTAIFSGDTFATIIKSVNSPTNDGQIVGIVCEECCDKDPEVNEGG